MPTPCSSQNPLAADDVHGRRTGVASTKALLTHGNSTTRLGDDVDELALMMVESMISVSRANAWAWASSPLSSIF